MQLCECSLSLKKTSIFLLCTPPLHFTLSDYFIAIETYLWFYKRKARIKNDGLRSNIHRIER